MVFTEDTIFLNLVRGEREDEKLWYYPYHFLQMDEEKELLRIYKKMLFHQKKRVLSLINH